MTTGRPAFSPEALSPDEFNAPLLKMGPFEASDLARNAELAGLRETLSSAEFAGIFGPAGAHTLTVSGREAIGLALEDLAVTADDEVCVVTTSGGPYISACVTEAISRRCRWTRTLSERTRAILMIHEFGFPAELPPAMAERGLPLIEDCAYALGSRRGGAALGERGDYVVFSLPKAFPVAYGGLLKSRAPLRGASAISASGRRELASWLAHYAPGLDAARARRREVFERYRDRLAPLGFGPLFEPGPETAPHSFVVALDDQAVAEAMKPGLQAAGIISSVFYGGGGYFLPNHQGLSDAAVDYIVENFAIAFERAQRR